MKLAECVFCECEVEEHYYNDIQSSDNRFKEMNLCKDCRDEIVEKDLK